MHNFHLIKRKSGAINSQNQVVSVLGFEGEACPVQIIKIQVHVFIKKGPHF